MTFTVGEYDVIDRLGEGAMGVVYRARDAHGEPCAVKFFAGDDHDAVRREVLPHARLMHPNIAMLRDVGAVSPSDVPPSEFAVGASYIVMDLARCSLRDQLPLQSWAQARAVLLQTLDGLAYAHARSVIHRDLKPSNLLVTGWVEGTPRIQIADFGISLVVESELPDDEARLYSLVGTPGYLAPEQALGLWQNMGPWTDLYALGCMAWELICGRPPFHGRSLVETVQLHMTAPRPPLEPMYAIPTGLGQWVQRAMAIAAHDRFRRAPDAARALLALGPAPSPVDVPAAVAVDGDRTWTHTLAPLEQETLEFHPANPVTPGSADWTRLFEERPPIPASPDTGETPRGAPRTTALLALRPTPLVGRAAECRALWGALRRARESGRPQVVVVVGAPGSGRSRLASWVSERGRELGVAGRLSGSFGPGGGRFGDLLRRAFMLWSPDDDVAARIRDVVPPLDVDPFFDDDVLTLSAIIHGSDAEISLPRQHAALRRYLTRIARINLPTVVLDDVDDDHRAQAFVEHLLGTDGPPCLVIATVDRENVTRLEVKQWLERLDRSDDSVRLDIGALTVHQHRELLGHVIALTPDAQALLATGTFGSPALAVQLVLDLADRGYLVRTVDGYALREGIEHELERDFQDVCLARFDAVVARLGQDSGVVWELLERGATLGQHVQRELLPDDAHAVLARAVTELEHSGLLEGAPDGFAFRSELIRRAVASRSAAAGRANWHHAECARALRARGRDADDLIAAANHWVSAGAPDAAVEPLLAASRELHRTGETHRRAAILDQLESVMHGRPQHDPARLHLEIERAQLTYHVDPEKLLAFVRDVEERYAGAIDPLAGCLLNRLAARGHVLLGDASATLDAARRSLEFARDAGDNEQLGSALMISADRLRRQGDLEAATELIEEARGLAGVSSYWRLMCDAVDAAIDIRRLQPDRALARLERVVLASRDPRLPHVEEYAQNLIGDIQRRAGRADAARAAYERQRILMTADEHQSTPLTIDLNLLLTDLLERRVVNIDTLVRGRQAGLFPVQLDLAEVAAHLTAGDVVAARQAWDDVRGRIAAGDLDEAWLTELCADYAAKLGDLDLARECANAAARIWLALGAESHAERRS